MKKLILLFSIVSAVLFTSCSKDINSSQPSVLVKKLLKLAQMVVLEQQALLMMVIK